MEVIILFRNKRQKYKYEKKLEKYYSITKVFIINKIPFSII